MLTAFCHTHIKRRQSNWSPALRACTLGSWQGDSKHILYLNAEKKALAFERIAAAMADDGWLMLGAGETVIGQTRKLGTDLHARGLYHLFGDGTRIEKRSGEDRRGERPGAPERRSSATGA